MLAELQGRLPIRVELKGLTREVRQPNLQMYTNYGVIMDIDLFSLLNSSHLQAYIHLWIVWG